MPGDRDWWRLAYTADGQLAGMILPNRNPYGAVVGYLGVLPGLRGRGYIDDLPAETTRFHAGRGEPRITATTDTTNQPMAAAFRRRVTRRPASGTCSPHRPAPASRTRLGRPVRRAAARRSSSSVFSPESTCGHPC